MVPPRKERIYAAATSLLLITTNGEYLSFDNTAPNSHQNLEMVVLNFFLGMNPMGLNTTLDDYKTNNYSEYSNFHQNLEIHQQNIARD